MLLLLLVLDPGPFKAFLILKAGKTDCCQFLFAI